METMTKQLKVPPKGRPIRVPNHSTGFVCMSLRAYVHDLCMLLSVTIPKEQVRWVKSLTPYPTPSTPNATRKGHQKHISHFGQIYQKIRRLK